MLTSQRVLHDDNGTFNDISQYVNNIFSETVAIPLVSAEDKLYIGSELPFNHRYFDVSTANTQASTVSKVEQWDGNSWEEAVDVVDETSDGTNAFAQSGRISWTLERNKSWSKEDTTEDITDMTSLKIYKFYWARITFTGSFDATTALNYVGFNFADDNDLAGLYPDLVLSSTIGAFKSGKTDWDEQHLLAAEEIIRYLMKNRRIWSGNQILNWEQFNMAAIHKVAEIILASFGKDFEDRRQLAMSKYLQAINMGVMELDMDEDGRKDEFERRPSLGLFRS